MGFCVRVLRTRRGPAQGAVRPRPLPRALLCRVALGWGLLCLAGGLLIVAPGPSQPLYFAGMVLTECSLVVTAAGGVGLGVAALYPVSDLAALYRASTRWWNQSFDIPAQVARFVGGTPTTVPDRYQLASPITHVDHGAPPTYLAHGTRDPVVPISQSLRLTQRLRDVGVPYRVVALRGSGHAFDLFGGGFNSQTTLSTLDDFLTTWLRPTPR